MSSRLVVTITPRYHRYSLDGDWVPSVTGITGAVGKKDALIGWAARTAAEWAAAHRGEFDQLGEEQWVANAKSAHDRISGASMLAGKQVHSIAERLVYGEPVEIADPETGEAYSDDVVRMGEQVARFMDVWQVSADTALVELPVFHEELRYAGTFDLCATLRGGERWLIDYKTGQTGVWPEHTLQVTGYSRATHVQIGDRDLLMPPINRCAALWVRPDGWELIPVKSDDGQWQAFMHAIEVAAWARQRVKDLVGAPLPVPA